MGASSDPNALEQQEPCNPDVLSLPSLRLKATSFPKNNSNAYKGYTGDKVKGKAAQSCPTFCDPMHCIYTVHGILQARILGGQPFLSPGDLPNPGIKPRSPTS